MKASAPGSIRAARPADAEAMHACVDAAYRGYISRLGKPPGPMLADYRQVATSPLAFVTEVGAEVVALAVLQKTPTGLLLDNIAVHPAHAGRGLGKQLMAYVEASAVAMGYGALDLYTHELMHENMAMYAAMGYVETERRSERGFARVYMRKRL